MENGFNAMGKNIPDNRLIAAYKTVREMAPDLPTETVFAIVGKCAKALENDNPYAVVGSVIMADPDIGKIDLTGRYRLMAVLLTEPANA